MSTFTHTSTNANDMQATKVAAECHEADQADGHVEIEKKNPSEVSDIELIKIWQVLASSDLARSHSLRRRMPRSVEVKGIGVAKRSYEISELSDDCKKKEGGGVVGGTKGFFENKERIRRAVRLRRMRKVGRGGERRNEGEGLLCDHQRLPLWWPSKEGVWRQMEMTLHQHYGRLAWHQL